jgi:hypothetical protein
VTAARCHRSISQQRAEKASRRKIIATRIPALAWYASIYLELRGKLSNIKVKVSTVKRGSQHIRQFCLLTFDF